jgi:hypothetical protein
MLKIHVKSAQTPTGNKLEECITFDLKMLNSMLDGVNVKTPGSWLHPHQVDNFIEIGEMPKDGSGNDSSSIGASAGNNRVLEFSPDSIANTLVECVLEVPNHDEPIDFIEIKRIDKGQETFPNIKMWENIFNLENGENYQVAPNGSLFVSNNGDNKLTVQFQSREKLLSIVNNNGFFALSYSVFFHFKKAFQDQPVYCVVDPIVQIRSRD